MTESPTLPLSNYDHVFYVTGNALIDASQEKVWSILTDFPSYGRWYEFHGWEATPILTYNVEQEYICVSVFVRSLVGHITQVRTGVR